MTEKKKSDIVKTTILTLLFFGFVAGWGFNEGVQVFFHIKNPGISKPVDREIRFFFGHEGKPGMLCEEKKMVPFGGTLERKALAIAKELFKGPTQCQRLIPENARLLGVVPSLKEKVARINLSQEVAEVLKNRDGRGAALIYSITNTLVLNFENIEAVRFYIEGKEVTKETKDYNLGQPVQARSELIVPRESNG